MIEATARTIRRGLTRNLELVIYGDDTARGFYHGLNFLFVLFAGHGTGKSDSSALCSDLDSRSKGCERGIIVERLLHLRN